MSTARDTTESQRETYILRVPQKFVSGWRKKEMPLNFPHRCAYCGSTENLALLPLPAQHNGTTLRYSHRVPYCHRHARALRIIRRGALMGGFSGGVVGLALAVYLHEGRVFAVNNVGLNLIIGVPVGSFVGAVPAVLAARFWISKEDRALADMEAPPVVVVAESSKLYAIRFVNQDYQHAFEALNPEAVVRVDA